METNTDRGVSQGHTIPSRHRLSCKPWHSKRPGLGLQSRIVATRTLRLTWAKKLHGHCLDSALHFQGIGAPPKNQVLLYHPAGANFLNVLGAEDLVPDVQVSDVPTEGLLGPEGAPQGILVLPNDEGALGRDGLGGRGSHGAQTTGCCSPLAIGVDGPGPVVLLPGHTEVMPLPISTEHGQVGGMVPVDNESKANKALLIHKATQLELVDESRHGVGEDGGNVLAPGVPLQVGTGCDSRQGREVREHLHIFCVCFVPEYQDWDSVAT